MIPYRGQRAGSRVSAVRALAAAIGAVLVVVTTTSVLRTLVIPRGRPGRLAGAADRFTKKIFNTLAARAGTYPRRDRVLAAQGPLTLLVLLVLWLLLYLLSFAGLLWPETHGFGAALRESGSSMFTLGFASTRGASPTAIDILAAAVGLGVVALQIAYLPTVYGAYNRRETDVTLLSSRAGQPAWGPELLSRSRYGLVDDLEDLYRLWERWAADVAESHSSYPFLLRFRSPQPLSSWLIGLLAVLDSAAMYLALAPSAAPVTARLCLRMGFTCLRQLADTIGLSVELDPRPDAPIQLTLEEFSSAVDRLAAVGFPIERSAEEAYAHFRGWRVNYEAIAYWLAYDIDAVPALWSGPRRHNFDPIPPRRPANRTPEDPESHTPVRQAPRSY